MAIMGLALLVRWVLDDTLGTTLPLSTVFTAMVVLVLTVRPEAFLLAALFGLVVGTLLFLEPRYSFPSATEIPILSGIVVLAFVAALLSWRVRDRAERFVERLAESERRFRDMADGLPLIVWVHGLNGEQEFVNHTFSEYFGTSIEEMCGERWRLLMHPEDADAYANEFAACVKSRRPFHGEVRVRRADGEWRWIESWARPRLDERGRFLGFVGTSADIHERKLFEYLQSSQREYLERLVDERTRELDRRNEQLRRTETLAVLGTLSRGLSHDMGNLLLPINAHLDMLASHELPPHAAESVEALKSAAGYLGELSQRLRTHLQPRSDGAAIDESLQEIRLDHWCRDTELFLRSVLPPNVQFSYSCDRNLPTLVADRASFTQTIYNLVQNAGQMIAEYQVGSKVEVRFEMKEESLQVIVEDDGPGMPPEVRERCLKAIFTSGPRSSGGGSGVGLSLVRGFIDAMGGRFDIQSPPSPGKPRGTAVMITLPVVAKHMGRAKELAKPTVPQS